MRVCIKPCTLRGSVTAPPSKSMGHRLMICAALADGISTLRGISDSQDMLATLDCLTALGAAPSQSGTTLTLRGATAPTAGEVTLPCRESGSTLRFLIPVALALVGDARLVGSERLMERGVGVYEKLFSEKNITVKHCSDGLYVSGRLTPGEYVLPGDVSSQFVSGLLFALPLLDGDSTVRVLPPVESRSYIDMTIAAMASFGAEVTEIELNTFSVKGNQHYRATDMAVEGDWSNAAFLYALQTLGHAVTVRGPSTDSLQGDKVCIRLLNELKNGCPTVDLSNCPDLGPVLFAVAGACHGATFTGTRRLQIKESDRARVMATELAAMGIRADVGDNTVRVYGGTLTAPDRPLQGHNDHRIVMALAILLSLVGGDIQGAEAVAKSYPDFFDQLERLGLEVTYDMES